MSRNDCKFKLCNRCLQLKELSEYYFIKKTNKPRPYCKECEKLMCKQYRMDNSNKIYEYQLEYRKKNKEIIKEKSKKYYLANREKFLNYQKEYYINKAIKEVKNNLYK